MICTSMPGVDALTSAVGRRWPKAVHVVESKTEVEQFNAKCLERPHFISPLLTIGSERHDSSLPSAEPCRIYGFAKLFLYCRNPKGGIAYICMAPELCVKLHPFVHDLQIESELVISHN